VPVLLADRIRAADPQIARGEAAVTVADRARAWSAPGIHVSRAQDALRLIGILGLEDASWQWDVARAARIILEQSRHGREVSANEARSFLPQRAHPYIPGALSALRLTGLAVLGDTVRRSTAPGARGSLVRCYRLTLAGERLAAALAPRPGEAGLTPADLEAAS
jgi:hypothetical protein